MSSLSTPEQWHTNQVDVKESEVSTINKYVKSENGTSIGALSSIVIEL